MKSWFAANIDTNKGLSGPFSFNHVPATRESGDAPTAPMGGAFCSAAWAVGLFTGNFVEAIKLQETPNRS